MEDEDDKPKQPKGWKKLFKNKAKNSEVKASGQ